jgi:hypothetical protein
MMLPVQITCADHEGARSAKADILAKARSTAGVTIYRLSFEHSRGVIFLSVA